MTNSWPPPEGEPTPPTWLPPQGLPSPNGWPHQPAPGANGWPQQYGGQQPYGSPSWNAGPRPKTTDDRMLEWTLPINRSGLAIAAGYVGLMTLPILPAGPIAVALGIAALADLRRNPQKLGAGRAWFAIIYGGIGTAILLFLVSMFLVNNL